VLIVGETGAGKEVLARYIHHNSTRSQGKFVAINCASLPETLLESELFGHKAGSFTGAVRDRIGLFEEANNGTIFLDEIGDISPAMQTRLLRVLQEHEVVRVGENLPRKITSRVISATHRDLAKEVAEGRFREDLYYRIRIIEIDVPPLRDRVDDILPLARFFIGKLSKKLKITGLRLDATCVEYLLSYPWPGNVRELENILERAAILAGDGVIRPEHLPFSMTQGSGAAERARMDPLSVTLSELELSHIREVLRLCGGNKAKAAKALGISAATMWRKLKE
jgi:transcriptional regulator with PAS, ATPase and Fis domain